MSTPEILIIPALCHGEVPLTSLAADPTLNVFA